MSNPRLSPNSMTEGEEQEALFDWIRTFEDRFPILKLIHHVPNGGHRNKATAAKLKAQGVRAGVLDISIPIPRHGFHGLYIEMKVGNNKMSKEQKAFAKLLIAEGYDVRLAYTHQAAKNYIINYLRLPEWTR